MIPQVNDSDLRERRAGRFGDVLRTLRKAKGWSGAELAEHARVPPASIGHYERGAQVPRVDALTKVARALGVPEQFLAWFAHTPEEPSAESPEPLREAEKLMQMQLRVYTDALQNGEAPCG